MKVEMFCNSIFPAFPEGSALPEHILHWDGNPPSDRDYYRHQLSILNVLLEADTYLFRESRGTQVSRLLLVGTGAAATVEALPWFESNDVEDPHLGERYVGRIRGNDVRRSIWVPKNNIIVCTDDSPGALRAMIIVTPYIWR